MTECKFNLKIKYVNHSDREEEVDLFLDGDAQSKALQINGEQLFYAENCLNLLAIAILGESALDWIGDYDESVFFESYFKEGHVQQIQLLLEEPSDLINHGILQRIVDEYPNDKMYFELCVDRHCETSTYLFGKDYKIIINKDGVVYNDRDRKFFDGKSYS